MSEYAASLPLLTGRQLQIIAAIEDLTDARGYPPNLREVAAHIGASAVSGLHYQLSRLRALGVVAWQDGQPRTLRVLHRQEATA